MSGIVLGIFPIHFEHSGKILSRVYGKSGELGKLLAGKCWYLEGNFEIWKEIVHFCTQKHINFVLIWRLACREIKFFQAVHFERIRVNKVAKISSHAYSSRNTVVE